MTTQFYHDRGDPDVARLAQAICTARGQDPFEIVADNGYNDAAQIPLWWKDQDFAAAFLACNRALPALGIDATAGRAGGSWATLSDDKDPRWPLSVEVIDTVSRLIGRVTAVTYHLNGSVNAYVEPKFPEGTRRVGHWITLDRLEPFRGEAHLVELG